MTTVHTLSGGFLTPLLAYAVSCLGAFLGPQCVTRAAYHQGLNRVWWLGVAAAAIGATAIWAMHFIAMLGFSIPGQQITYNVPMTIGSMLLGITLTTFTLSLMISLSPSQSEISADAEFRHRLQALQRTD